MSTADDVRARVAGIDSAKAAGLVVIGAVVVLGALRKGFAGLRLHIGD